MRGQAGGGGGGEGAGGSGGDERLEAVRRQLGDAQRAAVDAVDRAAARGAALDAVGVKAEALRDDADSFRNKGRGPKKDGGFAGKKQKTAWRKVRARASQSRRGSHALRKRRPPTLTRTRPPSPPPARAHLNATRALVQTVQVAVHEGPQGEARQACAKAPQLARFAFASAHGSVPFRARSWSAAHLPDSPPTHTHTPHSLTPPRAPYRRCGPSVAGHRERRDTQ